MNHIRKGMTDKNIKQLLIRYAAQYETAGFIDGDPSWFMHQVSGEANREAMAFLASSISYGSRSQFMPKIKWMLDRAGGDADGWVRSGRFGHDLPRDDHSCFYRLFTCHQMHLFLGAYRQLLIEHGTLGTYVSREARDGFGAVEAICRYFAASGSSGIIPKNTQSACKRVCMFLRWMVRSGSPVDLGLWASFIDRRTLIMPLDTHVVNQSVRLGLLSGKGTTMTAARRLTATLAEIFPDDPLRADFALFGYGINARKNE